MTGRSPSGSRRGVALAGLGALAAGSALWAMSPLAPPEFPSPPTPHPEPAVSAEPVGVDVAAFRAPLWVAPPPPPVPEPAPPPPPPLRLELLAIVAGAGEYRAVLYDQEADKLLVVAPGQTLGPRTVAAITARDLVIQGSEGARTLSLEAEEAR